MTERPPWEDYAAAPVAGPVAGPWDDYKPAAPAPAKPKGMLEDVARSLESGADKGVAAVGGLPGFVVGGLDAIADAGARVVGGAFKGRSRKVLGVPIPFDDETPSAKPIPYSPQAMLPSAEEAAGAIEKLTGPAHKPETTPGRYAHAVGEMIGGGGPTAIATKPGLAMSILGGLGAETAGHAAKGSSYEPLARAGGALAGGLAGVTAFRPNVAERAVARAAEGATPTQIDAAEALFRDAAEMGVPLTRAEAVQQVTGGATRLGDVQRIVEGQGGLKPMMAERPAGIETAGRKVFDEIVPAPENPSMVGPQVGRAADAEIKTTQREINDATRPAYEDAAGTGVARGMHDFVMDDPIRQQVLREIRSDPALNRQIAHLPDNSVGVYDMMQRRLRERAEVARTPGMATTSNTQALAYDEAREGLVAAAEASTGSRAAMPGNPKIVGDYEQVRQTQSTLRNEFLGPLMAGPLGKIAAKDTTTKAAIEALFPSNPLPNSAGEIVQAVGALSQRNPWAARQLVRTHIESTFNAATRDLQSGANQFGGATFVAKLKGNEQQATNLAAAIRSLPGGESILPGFDRFLDVLQATGQRQRIGSQTAFNTELLADMKKGGAVGTAATVAAGGGLQLPKKLLQRYEDWSLGRNVDEIAALLTDPTTAPIFRHLATAERGSAKEMSLITRLLGMGAIALSHTEWTRRPVP